MAQKTKRHVYRVGDKIRIINPEMFVRCGYPVTFKDSVNSINNDAEQVRKIERFVLDMCDNTKRNLTTRQLKRVVEALAYVKVNLDGFGGRTRSIYTNREEYYLNREYIVADKFVVRTGEYYGPSSYGGDYEPGGLDNAESHVILRLRSENCWYVIGDPLAIQSKFVEPVAD